jgi:hypothetical protein
MLGLGFVWGCRPSDRGPQGTGDEARATLVQALDVWKAGGAIDELPKASPKIIMADRDWSAGRRLADYEIVEEPLLNGNEWLVYAQLKLLHKSQIQKPQRVCYTVTLGSPTSVLRSDFMD